MPEARAREEHTVIVRQLWFQDAGAFEPIKHSVLQQISTSAEIGERRVDARRTPLTQIAPGARETPENHRVKFVQMEERWDLART